MTDYDFFELGAPTANKTIDQDQLKPGLLPRIGRTNNKPDADLGRYEEDFESFE